jgi:hypothetical protein
MVDRLALPALPTTPGTYTMTLPNGTSTLRIQHPADHQWQVSQSTHQKTEGDGFRQEVHEYAAEFRQADNPADAGPSAGRLSRLLSKKQPSGQGEVSGDSPVPEMIQDVFQSLPSLPDPAALMAKEAQRLGALQRDLDQIARDLFGPLEAWPSSQTASGGLNVWG